MDILKSRTDRERAKTDFVTAELKQGFAWTVAHTQLMATVIGAFIVVGLGWAGWSHWTEKQETDLQARYFEIDSQIAKKKESFEAAKAEKTKLPPAAAAPDEEKKPTPIAQTGDLAKDYADLPQRLTDFASAHPRSKAGGLAALQLADILAEYKQPGEAIEVLKRVQSKGLVGGLVRMQLATLMANAGQCGEAMPVLNQIVADKSLSFLKGEAKLKIGVCQEVMGQAAQAEEIYKKVIEESKETSTARTAQKYLRLLKFKQNQEGKPN